MVKRRNIIKRWIYEEIKEEIMEENEVLFLAMDIHKEVETYIRRAEKSTIKDMTDTEKQAYKLGVQNTLCFLDSVLNMCEDGEDYVLNMNIEFPSDFDIHELREIKNAD